jgi:tol-pal system protein YbgF
MKPFFGLPWKLLAVTGYLLVCLTGCATQPSSQGRLGNLEIALVEMRDRQERQTEEFRERLESMEMSLLQQERFLQYFCSPEGGSAPTVPEARALPGRDDQQDAAQSPDSDPPDAPDPISTDASPHDTARQQAKATPSPAPQPEVQSASQPEKKPQSQPEKSPESGRRLEEANILYDQALARYRNDKYSASRKDFFAFQERYPDHPLMPNALYWQAETHYAQKQYAQSILIFKELSRRYPGSAKAPDALLKAGYAYEKLGDLPNARFQLQIVLDDYPDSPAAELARQRLPELNARES